MKQNRTGVETVHKITIARGGTLFRYVTNHPGRLSLLPYVGR